MAIDRTGISSLQTGAPDIKYTGDQGPRSPDQQLMASADPMLVEEYQKYVFEMEEMGQQPMSFREFVQQVMSGMAYGGTAKPTYTQSRKQQLAYGGVAGLDGRKKYGIGSWFQENVKDPIAKLIPNEIKDNPMLTAAIVGGGINQFGLPDWLVPDQIASGSNVGQNWLGDLISKVPGTPEDINTVIGGGGGGGAENLIYGMPQASPNQMAKNAERLKYLGQGQFRGEDYNRLINPHAVDGSNVKVDNQQALTNALNKARGLPTSTLQDAIKYAQGLPTGTGIGTKLRNFAGQFLGGGGDGGQQYDEQGRPKVNWMGPLAIGTTAGAIQAAMPQAQLPQDTSGIDIPAIRAAALRGEGDFLPPASATTAYAQGGRTGYQDAGEVQQDVFVAWDEYKSGGGEENFNDWFSDIYLPGAGRPGVRSSEDLMADEERARALVQAKVVENIEDARTIVRKMPPRQKTSWPTGDHYRKAMSMDAPEDFERGLGREGILGGMRKPPEELINLLEGIRGGRQWPAGREQFEDDLPYGAAQGGRIGAQEGGLMNLGGMEKDYRQEGGFVPLGGEERADDVPARLSKNEFVFTADAVRAAGGGDIDAGAEVMENLMNNLEQGGQVSEDSQGLEGARDMFATAQRLEGVM